MTKYSVIIPAFNRAHLIQETLDSLLRQTCRDFEIIVCDDGSTDGTSQALEKYSGNIRLVRSNQLGPAGARNTAIAHAQGQYIACLDSDDIWAPWTLECVDAALASAQSDCLVYLPVHPLPNPFDVTTLERAPLSMRRYEDFLSAPINSPYGSGSIGAIPRTLIAKVGGFDESMRVASDLDLAMKLAADIPYLVIDSPITLLYRWHEGNISHSQAPIHIASYSAIIAKEMEHHAYPGGNARRKERRIRIGRPIAEHVLRFLAIGEYRQSLALYRKVCRLMLSTHCWRFAALFPLLACLHLVLNPTNLFRQK